MVKVAACQAPDIRGDIGGALSWIKTYSEKAETLGVDLLSFPECFLQGYLVEDGLARRYALDLRSSAFESVLRELSKVKPVLVLGMIELEQGILFNTAVVIRAGKLSGSYRKVHLMEGERVFSAGAAYPVFEAGELRFGINICYDTNFSEAAAALAAGGAQLIVCPSNNMMTREKAEKYKHVHNQVRAERCRESGLWLMSSDVVGGKDNRICYGPTAIINPAGEVVSQVPLFEEGMVVGEIELL